MNGDKIGDKNDAVRLAAIFGDGLVLQREVPAPVWGTAPAGTSVTLDLDGRTARATADASGAWTATFPALDAGGPFPLTVNGRVVLDRVWVGDVWLCAGQSNMERSLEACASWPTDVEAFRGDPGIRQLCLPNQFDFAVAQTDLAGARWVGADTDEVGKISAVGFHFARAVKAQTGVPQGLVLLAVGGSTAQSWLSRSALEAFPRHRDEAARFADAAWFQALRDSEARRLSGWFAALEALDPKDPVRAGHGAWRPTALPSAWAATDVGDRRGSVWYRKTFVLDEVPKTDAKLRLGTLVDSDETWVNGHWVGATGYQYPSRRYPVPASFLRKGKNTVLIRLVSPRGGGGVTHGKALTLEVGPTTIDLAGTWEWRPGAFVDALPADTFLPLVSAGLHYGELLPLVPLSVKAVLWYQGESNTGDPSDYGCLMRALMDEWRLLWSQPDLPFFLVQLPLLEPPVVGVQDHGWAEVRDIQRRLAEDEASALVVILDLGEWNDLHPSKKEGVGLRLARAVLFRLFGVGAEPYTGPLVTEAVAEGPAVRVSFAQASGGLAAEGRVEGVYLTGDDGVAYRAEATIDGSSLVVSSPAVDRPRTVYYAWAVNPAGANLANRAGLPASPFRVTVKSAST
jgi:sialate O-acetylesterase